MTLRQKRTWVWWIKYYNGYKDPPREFVGGPPHVTAANRPEIEKKLAMAEKRRSMGQEARNMWAR